MKQTHRYFTHDALLNKVRTPMQVGLKRHKTLENFLFLNTSYLISLDDTGIFSSSEVHCENCSVKKHRDGSVMYSLSSDSGGSFGSP